MIVCCRDGGRESERASEGESERAHQINACIDVTARRLKGTCHTSTHADDVENNGE